MQATMEGMLKEKLQRKLEANRSGANKALTVIENEGNIINDSLVTIGKNSNVGFTSNGSVYMNIRKDKDIADYKIHPHAVEQISEKFSVPAKFMKELAVGNDWQKKLCSKILSDYTYNSPAQRFLVREVAGTIRGMLSDKYRRLNSPEIFKAFLEEVKKQNGVLFDAYTDDIRCWIETVVPHVITVPTEKNGDLPFIFGCRISTSDFGEGSVDVRTLMYLGKCINGQTFEKMLREVHLGARLSDNIRFSEKTYRLDTMTVASAVKDMTANVFSQENIVKRVSQIQNASHIEIKIDDEIKKLPRLGLLKGEISSLVSIITNNREDDGMVGGNTILKLSQAVAAVARDSENLTRRRELEEISGRLILEAA